MLMPRTHLECIDLSRRPSIPNGLHGPSADLLPCVAAICLFVSLISLLLEGKNMSRASDYGWVKVDGKVHIIHFSEKPKGVDLKAMQEDTSLFGLSPQDE